MSTMLNYGAGLIVKLRAVGVSGGGDVIDLCTLNDLIALGPKDATDPKSAKKKKTKKDKKKKKKKKKKTTPAEKKSA